MLEQHIKHTNYNTDTERGFHDHTHHFRQWIGRTLTRYDRSIINHLERFRRRKAVKVHIIDKPGQNSTQLLIDYMRYIQEMHPLQPCVIYAPTRKEANIIGKTFPGTTLTASVKRPNTARGMNYDMALVLNPPQKYLSAILRTIMPAVWDRPGCIVIIHTIPPPRKTRRSRRTTAACQPTRRSPTTDACRGASQSAHMACSAHNSPHMACSAHSSSHMACSAHSSPHMACSAHSSSHMACSAHSLSHMACSAGKSDTARSPRPGPYELPEDRPLTPFFYEQLEDPPKPPPKEDIIVIVNLEIPDDCSTQFVGAQYFAPAPGRPREVSI